MTYADSDMPEMEDMLTPTSADEALQVLTVHSDFLSSAEDVITEIPAPEAPQVLTVHSDFLSSAEDVMTETPAPEASQVPTVDSDSLSRGGDGLPEAPADEAPQELVADSGAMPLDEDMSTEGSGDEDSQSLAFDSDFLSIGKEAKGSDKEKHVDLSYFAHKGGMAPGRYAVQVKVNGKMVDEGRMVTFKSWPNKPGKLYACVSAQELLTWWGIKASREVEIASSSASNTSDPVARGGSSIAEDGQGSAEEESAVAPDDAGGCVVGGVVSMVPFAKEEFDFNSHLLSLTVPQASLGPASRLRMPLHMWDSGTPAILMNYNYNGSQQNTQGKKSGSDFLGVNGQLNLLGWRFRSDMTAFKRQGAEAEVSWSQAYAQRDFASFGGGQLTLGHTSASAGGVDSVSFLGVTVESDEGMVDPTLSTYRPAISGIAESPATVTVRQYGKIIYRQNLPQGPFSLTDFNRSGNGDVEVVIRESDGRVRRFTLAQASNGVLLRQGAMSYSASAGKAENSSGYVDDRFMQLGGSYGVWANTTVTGGALISSDYQAVAVGTGFNAGALGAFSYTLKGGRADLSSIPGERGQAFGFTNSLGWSRSFGSTSLGLSYARSLTADAIGYSELLSMKPKGPKEAPRRAAGSKDSLGVSVSQSLGQWGSVALSGSRSTSWGSNQVQQSATLGYNTTIKDVGIGIAFGYSASSGRDNGNSRRDFRDDNDGEDLISSGARSGWGGRSDRSISLTVSLPLGKWLGSSSVNSGSYSYTKSNGSASQQTGFSGSVMGGPVSYSVSQGLTQDRTGSASVGYSGRYGSVSGGYSYGGGSDSVSYSVNGGMAIHPHGATLGKPLALSGGNALVEIPGAGGINVGSATTDWRGYALLSGLTPYDRNRVNVDMTNLPGNLELDSSSKNVVPTRGALVSVPFKARKGFRLLLNLSHKGAPVLFGSEVTLKQEDSKALNITGIVGDAGQAYLSGMPSSGAVTVSWGDAKNEQCTATYALPANADMTRVATATAVCH
ncbi:fimbria/pilus outer membrane usher protein [Pseudomonas canadensis]|uniref:fimbria/pilus outer membrane usher protein n=1 Tax=Pseudomonas canadensis TaxID=915099 RepID=UPI003BA149FB